MRLITFAKFRNICVIFFLFVLISHLILTATKNFQGDGHEYILMTESLQNHFSPEVRLTDIFSLAEKVKKRAQYNSNNDRIFTDYMNMIQSKLHTSDGYFRALNNQYYSYHFWLYSLLNVPGLWLADLFGFSPVHSFLITHLIIFIATLVFITLFDELSIRQRYFIGAFYLLSGTTYYFSWSHPELFSASFFLIGLLLLLKSKFIRSALFFALAAQQNPPIGFFVIVAFIFSSGFIIKSSINWHIATQQLLKKLPAFIGVISILFMSPLFFYSHFGVPNLIIKLGYSSSDLISYDRLWSLFFDFNQGMIVGIPFAFLILLIVLMILIFTTRFSQDQRRKIAVAIAMLFAMVILSIPCLSTGNWNSGQSVFLRYAYWLSMLFGIALMLLIDDLSLRMFRLVFILFLVGQIFVLATHLVSGRNDSSVKNKSFASYLINNKPDWYNPIPAIFVERGQGSEVGPDENKIYYNVNAKMRSVTKVLYHVSQYHAVLPVCHHLTIEQLAKKFKSIATENKWFYLNLPFNFCKTNQPKGLYSLSN